MADENRSFNLFSKASVNGGALGGQQKKEEEEEGLVYGLRENRRKSFRVADPELHSANIADRFVQDRESETETTTPTRKRSNRNGMMKSKEPISEKPSPAESKSEQMSSGSNTSPEEDIALCLLMLSRDESMIDVRTMNFCKKCKRVFRSCRALRVHSLICFRSEKESKNGGNEKSFECPVCERVFGSGQALGGHKRSHLLSSTPARKHSNVEKSFTDLNLPVAVEEDDDYSVVSDP